MRISIVVPSLNQAKFLPACLSSVLSQQPPQVDLEVLVFDGGSTDGSHEIIKSYASQLTYWQSHPDGGQAAALKAGFLRATGEILGWVNSDDMLLPGALTRTVEYFTAHPKSPMVYGDAIWIDSAGLVVRPKREIEFDWNVFAYGYCYIPQPSAFFRASAYVEAGGIDASLKCCMDYDLWHRLCALGPIGHISAFMSGLRDHPVTKTRLLGGDFGREHEILRQRYLGCSGASYRARHMFERARRIWLRAIRGCYRPITDEELAESRLDY